MLLGKRCLPNTKHRAMSRMTERQDKEELMLRQGGKRCRGKQNEREMRERERRRGRSKGTEKEGWSASKCVGLGICECTSAHHHVPKCQAGERYEKARPTWPPNSFCTTGLVRVILAGIA